jgi:hypothetical protein
MKIGSSVIEPCGNANVHFPNQSSVPVTLIAGTLLDGFARRYAIVRDVGTEDDQTTFVDEFTERIDDPFHRALGEAFNLSKDDLYRAVDDPLLQRVVEHQFEGSGQVVKPVGWIPFGQEEIIQVSDLDGFRSAFVGHSDLHAGTLASLT